FVFESLEEILHHLGGDWASSWQMAEDNGAPFTRDAVESVLRTFESKLELEHIPHGRLEAKPQLLLGTLVNAVQEHMGQDDVRRPRLTALDTHSTSTANRTKPDLVFLADSSRGCEWTNIVACVEVKSVRHTQNDSVLRGQLVQRLLDMAESHPRRFVLALSVAKDDLVRVYLYTSNRLLHCELGSLPSVSTNGVWNRSVKDVVKFLIMLYSELPKDYGFLARRPDGLHNSFRLTDIPGCDTSGIAESLRSASFGIRGTKAFGGRRWKLSGPRSWIFRTTMDVGDNCDRVIFKFQWHRPDKEERLVHEQVSVMGVPHIPRLILAAPVNVHADERVVGEVMVVEDAGQTLDKFFAASSPGQEATIIDLFAGYAHTLLAAADGSSSDNFVLHRDISARNLTVRNHQQPFVIDWGCGRVMPSGGSRTPSAEAMVGTAMYMALRVLAQKSQRSVIDDLESLFLVFSHCLWAKYGDTTSNAFKTAWDFELGPESSLTNRTAWLISELSYINEMGLHKRTPAGLKTLAKSLYRLLFSKPVDLYELKTSETDPRVELLNYSDWAAAFASAAKLVSPNHRREMSCLQQLQAYVNPAVPQDAPQVREQSPPPQTGLQDLDPFQSPPPAKSQASGPLQPLRLTKPRALRSSQVQAQVQIQSPTRPRTRSQMRKSTGNKENSGDTTSGNTSSTKLRKRTASKAAKPMRKRAKRGN
ncbi:hypothetical protein LPJ63_004683, partial [Coemansia sp. RSA 2711]